MKPTSFLKTVCMTVITAVGFCAFAQESTESSAESSAEEKPAESVAPVADAAGGKDIRFLPLMHCVEVQGGMVDIRSEDGKVSTAVAGRYYPFGSEVRLTGGSDAVVRFEIGAKSYISIFGSGAFATRTVAIGDKMRTVLLKEGTVGLDLPRSLKDGLITVASPDFVCSNLAGESRYECKDTTDVREVAIRVVTGTLGVEGRHYRIAQMGAANQVRISTSSDALMTSLRGESGDYKVLLDCGVKSVLDPDTGAYKDVPQTIEYALSPKCAIKIWRKVSEKAAGGSGRMAVAIQTFDAQGRDKNFRAFFEARSNVNSGELVASPKDAAKAESEKNKSAAEDVEEVSTSAETKESSESEGSSSSEGSSAESSGSAAPAAESSGDGL